MAHAPEQAKMTRFETREPRGRLVVLDLRARTHLQRRRPAALGYLDAVIATVSSPDMHEDDPISGRERFYRRDLTGSRWLRVVVDFTESPAFVVTAFVQDNQPEAEA